MQARGEHTMLEHLSELRKRLIIVAITLIATLIIGFLYAPNVLHYVKAQPAASHIEWHVFSFTEGFFIYAKCAVIVAIACTLPVLLYHIWAFILPALTKKEATQTFLYIPVACVLFIIGIAFSYLVVFPMVIQFMTSINESIGATETYGMSHFFTLLFNIVLPISVIFDMPVVIMFLTKLGILHPNGLRKSRKVSYFVLVIIGVSLTPPDVVSDLLIIIPLIALFEMSILCASWTFVRQHKRQEERT